MNRLKLLAMATLMAVTFTACDEGTPPPVEPPPPPDPVGTISGTVTIDGEGAAGLTATLSSGTTTTTNTSGAFSFADVVAGSYTVSISGFADDVTFPSASQSATIASDGQTVNLNFAGQYIRSSSVVGAVVASDAMMSSSGSDGQPETLAGVTVTLTGAHAMGEQQETNMETGGYAFTGLRAGSYTVTISGYPDDVEFEELSMTVEVGVGEVGTADFEGAFIRTAAIEGRVIIEGEGLPGVTVTLVGGPADESHTKMTGADGEYAFTELRPGDYQVDISGYDPRDYEFAATSQEVSVGLDETETVSFTGELLRTAGIAGRVSVEGMGLGEIAVTLSGAADASTTTDASGQYAFAGLAAGDYTVSIAVESDAYVFDAMSADVTVGDDQSAIVNFEGAHATTASVSGMLFIDELDKNDMMDEGEHPLPAPGVPVALVGPGVNDQRLGATGPDGTFMFAGLRAGPYQLIVPPDPTVTAALAAQDLAYGGPATGYAFALGVGEARTQAVPFDITHTTVNFTVSLKSGEETGDAVPGAMVTLYSDAAGETKVGGGETGDDGSVAIKVARAGTSGNMVHAGVSADGYSVTDGMTAVSWNPQFNMTAGANDNDIVNLNVDVTVSGATITTGYGGGDALAGWAISVMSGEDAVDGAPEALDDDGNAAFMTTVAAVPASFSIALAEDQDDEMDGGESYEADAVEYTHTGLSLAGTMDAGSIVANYTTQTLKVYVHHERDQVMGYTGNVLDGDARDDAGNVSVGLRYIDGSGRSRSFTKAMWDAAKNTSSSKGVHTFSHLPADMNVIAQAEADADGIKLLDPDELAAFRNMEDNGVTGGAFGDMGGFSHTVELCPLKATNPQDHGECASFGYVSTYTVSGLVWKNDVVVDPKSVDFLVDPDDDPTFVPGITVMISPVDGKNLAGDEESYTSTEKDDRADKTKGVNPTHMFNWDDVASGAYTLSVPSGWRAKMGGKGDTIAVGNTFNPLGGDVSLDVTPATGLVYGRVTDGDGFALDSVTVTANGVSAMTDDEGRYIIDGISAETRTVNKEKQADKIFVETAQEGHGKTFHQLDFMANTPQPQDIDLSGVGQTASVSGTVRASGSNAPVAGVEITVDGGAPQNAATSGSNAGKLVTGADGTYTAVFEAKAIGSTVDVSASKDGMIFVPAVLSAPAHAGSEISGIDFVGFVNATISGKIRGPDGRAMSGVTVTATAAAIADEEDAEPTASSTTRSTGTFSLSVPFGSYVLAASTTEDGVTFDIPTGYQTVNVAPGQSVNIGTIDAMSPNARGVSVVRGTATDSTTTEGVHVTTYVATTTVRWTANAEDVPAGYENAVYAFDVTDTDGTWVAATSADLPADSTGYGTFDAGAAGFDGEFMVRVSATLSNDTDEDPEHGTDLVLYSDPVTVAAIEPSVTSVEAARDTTNADLITAGWSATTNSRTTQRIVVQFSDGNWYVAGAGTTLDSNSRRWSLDASTAVDATSAWTSVDGQATRLAQAELAKALNVAVESVQGTQDDDDNPWLRSAAVSVSAKPDDG